MVFASVLEMASNNLVLKGTNSDLLGAYQVCAHP